MPPFAATDLERFKTWKATQGFAKDKAFEALMDGLNGPVMAAVNVYRAAPLPLATLELEAKRLAGEAVNEWDPNKGMSLASYVGTMVRQRLFRYVGTYQNAGRLPEEQIRRIGGFQRATNHLTDVLGREPTTDELADHMGVPVTQITRLRKSLRKDVLDSGLDSLDDLKHDEGYESVMLAYHSLSAQEKQVFDFSLGAHGQPQLDGNGIATRLGVAPSRVSAIKASLGTKLAPYLKG